MIEFKILTQRYQNKIEEKIRNLIEIKQLDEKAWKCREEGELYAYTFLCHKKERESTLQTIANIVSDIVQEEGLTRFAEKYLRGKSDLKKEEKKAVKEIFILNNYIAKEEGVSYISYYVVYTPILQELENYQQMNIEGWIAFRMKKYHLILKDILEQVIADYKTQKEYLECINLIVELRRHQKTSENILHLIPKDHSEMSILSDRKEDVTKDYIHKYCEELLEEGEVRIEDLVMHILITAPPKQLVIHNKANYTNKKFIQTLELIFKGYTSYCTGCEYCTQIKEK